MNKTYFVIEICLGSYCVNKNAEVEFDVNKLNETLVLFPEFEVFQRKI